MHKKENVCKKHNRESVGQTSKGLRQKKLGGLKKQYLKENVGQISINFRTFEIKTFIFTFVTLAQKRLESYWWG